MFRRAWLGVATAFTLASSAVAAPASGFLNAPSDNDVMSVYPPAARTAGWGGYAVLHCRHDAEGLLVDCKADSSDWYGYAGFAEAGLKLAPKFKLDMAQKPPREVSLLITFIPAVDRPGREPSFARGPMRWPNLAPIGDYWPEAAQRTHTTGVGVIDCKAAEDNRLSDCRFVAEQPAGADFGHAALRMASEGFMTAGPPKPGQIAPSDGVWRFTVEFKAPKSWN